MAFRLPNRLARDEKSVPKGPTRHCGSSRRHKTEDGDFIDLYAVKCYWKVHKGGDEDLRFDVAPTNDGGAQGDEMLPLPAAVDNYINGERVNVVEALQDVVEINDDNKPAPENVPRNNDNNTGVFGEWGTQVSATIASRT